MRKFKPVIASVIVVVVALGGMVLWKWSQGDPRPGGNTSEKLPCSDPSADGYEFVTEPMEDLPALDPPSLWPLDGRRMAAPEFWVIWRTSEFTKCRLWASHGENEWIEIGNTAGVNHYLLIDLSEFKSEVSFMVDFTERGKRYRSHKRRVSYGLGANFKRREYTFKVDESAATEGWVVGMHGRETHELSSGDFKFYVFPRELSLFGLVTPREASDEVRLGIYNPDSTPEEGCYGFVEVYDSKTATYDRALINLKR